MKTWFKQTWCGIRGHRWMAWEDAISYFLIIPFPVKVHTCSRCGKQEVDINL